MAFTVPPLISRRPLEYAVLCGSYHGGPLARANRLDETPDRPITLFDAVPDPEAPDGSTNLLMKQDVFLNSFASDLPRPEATRLWATQRATSTAALKTPTPVAAWKTIPS